MISARRRTETLSLMVRSAPQERVSNHVAATSFETRAAPAPQDEADRGRSKGAAA
jgi:hypothetical protein